MARVPPIALVRQFDTHRLIPSRYSAGGESVLARIADDDAHLRDIFELDGATNDRLLAEQQRFPGIGIEELVFGVPCSHVINAPFCHPHPLGSRFNGPDRGAWYAGFALETSQAEVAFHKSVALAETGWTSEESITYDDYLADFSAAFHDLRRATDSAPASIRGLCRVAGARRASSRRRVLGIVYRVSAMPEACACVFRPPLVVNVRRDATQVYVHRDGHR